MDLIVKLLIYGVILGGIILYFYLQRRQSNRHYLHTFNENFSALDDLVKKSSDLTYDEEVACISYFLESYWIFDGIILPEYLDSLYPEVDQSAWIWEVRALQLRELQSEQRISQQQVDILLDMKKFVLFLETARWPGVSYHEQEFLKESCKKICIYYETMHEVLTLIEQH